MKDSIAPTMLLKKCPRLISKYMRQDKKEVLISPEAEKGTEIHKLLADYLLGVNNKYLEKFPKPASLLKLKEMSTDIKVETPIEFGIDGIKVYGRADIVFFTPDTVIIVDMKTNPRANITIQLQEQLRIYSYPFLAKEKDVHTYLFKPTYNTLMKVEVLDTIDGFEIEKWLKEKTHKFIELANKEEVRGKGGYDCQYCPYSISCPANIFKDIEEDPESYISEYIKVKAKFSQMEKIAKSYMEDKKPMVVNGMEVGYQDSLSLDIDVGEFIRFAVENNMEVEKLLNVNKTEFKKQAKKIDGLADLGNYVHTTRWSVRKYNKNKK